MYYNVICLLYIFFFNDTATTEIYTLSLHDALPISVEAAGPGVPRQGFDGAWIRADAQRQREGDQREQPDRKSTRLNSSHANISYAVFCLKKKKRSYVYVVTPHEYVFRTFLPLTEYL